MVLVASRFVMWLVVTTSATPNDAWPVAGFSVYGPNVFLRMVPEQADSACHANLARPGFQPGTDRAVLVRETDSPAQPATIANPQGVTVFILNVWIDTGKLPSWWKLPAWQE